MVRRRKYLPQVPIYELVSIIPDTFGGMVTVALQRSSAFADLDGRRIDILTKSPNMVDQDVRTQQLRSTGQISGNVRIRNVWSDLGTRPDDELAGLRSQVDPVLPAADELPDPDRTRQPRRFGDTEDVLQIDRFRSDGTRAICDKGTPGSAGCEAVASSRCSPGTDGRAHSGAANAGSITHGSTG